MRIVTANKSVLFLGMKGENGATQVRFPVSKQWKQIYGEGAFALAFLRPTEVTPYACTVTDDGVDVLWDISNTETAIVGEGRAELLYYVDGAIAKSATYLTTVVDSITAVEGDPPEPWESWIEQVIAAGAAAVDAAGDATQAKTDAEAAAGLAEGYCTRAETAADAAERAQGAAEAAQDAAEAAQSRAEDAEDNAQDAATAAGTAQDKAEEAQGKAETARDQAETYAQSASGSASSAAADAGSASASALAAQNSADAAADYADQAHDEHDAAVQAAQEAEAYAAQAEVYAMAPVSLFAFKVDTDNMHLMCAYTVKHDEMGFSVDSDGHLIITIDENS